MKNINIISALLFSASLHGQFNVVRLLEQVPPIPETFGTAYVNSKLVTSSETMDDGRIFKRVKSWEPSLDIKKFDDQLEKYNEKIDAKAEQNSFSLHYVPDNSPENKAYLKLMIKTADSLKNIWSVYTKRLLQVCPDFMPLSEEYGCDEIKASGLRLNGYAMEKNKILEGARKELKPLFDLVQRYFNKLYLIEDPMTNNQVLNEIGVPLQILREWYSEVSIVNSHMVETGISLNNAFCMMNEK
ncbi:MAG: hypothetical protein HOP11_02295 [Saprospiraceae bacterium]|nr:hypothetical protein [Saprospiraceae bacterium]